MHSSASVKLPESPEGHAESGPLRILSLFGTSILVDPIEELPGQFAPKLLK